MAIIALTYTVAYSDKDAAKVLSVLDDCYITPNGGKHLANGISTLTFDYDTVYCNGVNDECEFIEDDFDLYEAAQDCCDGLISELKEIGVDATVDYDSKEVQDIADDLADEYPQESEYDDADDWVHERLCGNI